MAEKSDFIVDGFSFGSKEDAEIAHNERKRIAKIEEQLDYSDSHTVNAVLNKAVNNRVFKTPIGYEFLRKLQIAAKNGTEEVPNIPVYEAYSLRENEIKVAKKVTPSTKKPKKTNQEFLSRKTSIIINVVLLVLVFVMFLISMTGSTPTILNYERTLQNRYAEWEEELEDREAVIRDKEKELLINE